MKMLGSDLIPQFPRAHKGHAVPEHLAPQHSTLLRAFLFAVYMCAGAYF